MRIALEPIVSLRRRAVLETTLRAAARRGLPDAAAEIIRRVAGQARLWPGECADVAAELIAHFEDGRDAGVPEDELVGHFGNPELTARLIGSAKRRQRPALWHALRHAVTVTAAAAGLVLLVYAGSAATLYLNAPARNANAATTALATTVERTRAAWTLTTASSERRLAAASTLVDAADAFARQNDAPRFVERVRVLFAMADTSRGENTVAGDMAAGLIEGAAATLVTDAIDAGAIDASHPALAELVPILAQTPTLHGARGSFQMLLDEMYTCDEHGRGHLTGAGIDVLRELKHWGGQSTQDKLLEPAWYAFPAARQDVVERFERLCELSEHAGRLHAGVRGVEAAMAPIKTSLVECLRYPAISAVHHQLVNVLVATERSGQARHGALRVIEEHERAVETSMQ